MTISNQLRAHYFIKALIWGAVALLTATLAYPYLAAFVKYVQGGLHGV